MKIFLDSSALFKLYQEEIDSEIIEKIFIDNEIKGIFLSELAKIEFSSTVWKKVRTNEISTFQAEEIINSFEIDYPKYTFIQIDSMIIQKAINLLVKYGKQGLRTLDSIQLATSDFLKGQCDLFISADRLLISFFEKESLNTK